MQKNLAKCTVRGSTSLFYVIIVCCEDIYYGGEGVLSYISQKGMCRPKRVGFLTRFGLKTGIDFAHFGLELGMVFEGTTGVYERMYGFNCK